jgi:hypothetical protein
MAETRAAEKRLKIFISYSRRDLSFAQQIVSALEARGVAPKIDMRDLPKLEDWRRELLEEFVAIYSIVTSRSACDPDWNRRETAGWLNLVRRSNH